MMESILTKLLFGLLGGLALLLGVSYVYSAWASRAAVEVHPPHGRFVDVEGVRLHYVDGGAIVLAYALKYPQATAGVVLIGGAAYPWKGGVAWTNHAANLPVIGPLFASTVVFPLGRMLLDGAVKEVFAPNSPPPDYVERTGIVLALRPDSFQASAEDVLRLSPYLEQQSRRYETFAQPLLLITGDSDDVVPAWNHAHRLARLLPQARLVELEATGHAPHHVHPEAVTTLIADFAAEIGVLPHSAHASSSLSRREFSD